MLRTRPLLSLSAALVLAAALAGPTSSPAAPSELQKATAIVKPAVVYIKTEFFSHVAYGGNYYGPIYTGAVGSGFFVNPDGFVVTNAHVVEPTAQTAQQIRQNFALSLLQELGRQPSEEEVYRIMSTTTLVEADEGLPIKPKEIQRQVYVVTKSGVSQVKELQSQFKAEVRAESPMMEKDIAILKVAGSNFPTVKLGDSDEVDLQDQVTVLGYPGVVQNTFERTGLFGADSQMEVSITQGIISSNKTWHDGSPILGTDAGAAHGNSGGPAINSRGEVIGILSMGAISPQGDNYPFNFLRPINVAKDFVRASGVEAEVSLTESRYISALDAYWQAEELAEAGEVDEAREKYEEAKTNFQGVLNLYPQHPDAQTYLVRSEEALSQLPQGGAIPMPVLVAAILGALLLLGAVLVMRRRPQAAAAAPAASAPPPVGAPASTPGAASASSPRFTLEAESGPLAGHRYEVVPAGLTIGRDPARAQIVYQADTVSREHARFQPGSDGVIVTNLSSTNDTYVNGEAISQTTVKSGDRVRVSQVTFLVRG